MSVSKEKKITAVRNFPVTLVFLVLLAIGALTDDKTWTWVALGYAALFLAFTAGLRFALYILNTIEEDKR